MDLTELTDEPEFTIAIGGKTFYFSELRIGGQAKLQSWIKANIPDPLVTLRERLGGYPESVVAQVVSDARRDTPFWPPIMGSKDAAIALMGTRQGQITSLWVGMLIHQPDTTLEYAELVYRAFKKQRDDKNITRIFRIIFGTAISQRDEDDQENSPDPKGETAPVPASNGNSTSERLSSVSK